MSILDFSPNPPSLSTSVDGATQNQAMGFWFSSSHHSSIVFLEISFKYIWNRTIVTISVNGKIMVPKDAHDLIPRTSECHFTWQQGLVDVITVTDLRWEIILDYLGDQI